MITIEINGTDRTSIIDVNFLNIKDNLYSRAGACSFTYKKFGSRTYVPVGGDEIEIWDGVVKIFGGQIINFNVSVKGKIVTYEIQGKDWTDLLDGLLVAETYESKTVNEIITDLQSKYATTFDISNVNCLTNIEAIYFDNKPMSKCLDDLAEIARYHWFVDADKKIYFFAEGTILSPFDITDDNGNVISENLEITEDYGQIKNRINIEGGTVAKIQVYDSVSIASYGEHEVLIRDNTLTSIAEATQKANAVLASYKDPIRNGRFITYSAGLVSGQKININSSLRGINQDFIIQSVNFKILTPLSFVYEVEVMTQEEKGLIDLLEHEIIATPPSTITNFGDQNYVCDVQFSIIDYQKISWNAGTIAMTNGDSYSIALGNHTLGGSTEICYFDPSVSITVLQFSTTFADGVGDGKTALGYAIPNPNPALGAQFIPKGFMGGVRFWGGENIVARTIIADQIGLQALTSELVVVGEFITDSAQIKNAIITNAHITGTITVGHTEADKTSDNAQDYSWLTGIKPPTDADHTADIVSAMAYESMVEEAKLGTSILSGGIIKTDLLLANNIVTTGSTGKRIIISSSPQNEIRFYDGASEKGKLEITDDGTGGYYLRLGGDAGMLEIGAAYGSASINYVKMPFFEGSGKASSGAVYLEKDSGEQVGLIWSGGGNAVFSLDIGTSLTKVGSDLVPNDAYDLGSNTDRWQTIYASGSIYCGGNLILGSGSNLNPDSDVSDLGQSYDYFHQLYANLVRYKSIAAFDSYDDIQLMKDIKMKESFVGQASLVKVDSKGKRKITKRKDVKKEVWDEKTMPKEVYEDGFYDAGSVNGLLIGAVKQLIEKVETLENIINK